MRDLPLLPAVKQTEEQLPSQRPESTHGAHNEGGAEKASSRGCEEVTGLRLDGEG